MAMLQPRSDASIVQMIAAGIQGRASAILNFAIGSTLRAIAEGHAGVALWLQGLLLKLLLTTRAATSTGSDLDTFVQDFGLQRLGALPSNGTVNFIRFTASASTPFIPVGTTVQTTDGSQNFVVIADASNPLYSASLSGYTMPAFLTSITLPVNALNPGSASNALAGTVTILTTPIDGIDEVVNALAFTGGLDPETDADLRIRFQFFIASLSKATEPAIIYTVKSLQYGVQCTVTENFEWNGTPRLGFFYVTADDGSGIPTQALLTAVGVAVNVVRPLTVNFAVFPPVIINVVVSMTIISAAGFDHNAVIGNVGIAVATYINTLPLGQSLSYAKLMQVAFNADAGVTDILNYRLNGGLSDISAEKKNVIKTNSVTIV